jgi:hypothetical protein
VSHVDSDDTPYINADKLILQSKINQLISDYQYEMDAEPIRKMIYEYYLEDVR